MGYRWSEVRILSPRPCFMPVAPASPSPLARRAIRLPARRVGARPADVSQGRTPMLTATPHEETATRQRIVIADDESLIRLDLREMLTELGYDVVGEAGDGRNALDLARKLRTDLVIMDIKMPGVDGIAAAEELTREKIAPVVLLTAYSDQGLVDRAKDAGVVGYVVKPFRQT